MCVFMCVCHETVFCVLRLGAAKRPASVSAFTTEMAREKPSGPAESKVKPFAHINGLAVHSLTKPNMPSTISERASQKTGADVRRKSDPSVLSSNCDIRPSSVHPTAVNGHLPQSLSASKSKTPNGHEVPFVPTARSVSGGKKRVESNDRDRLPKENGVASEESYRSKMSELDSFVAKAVSGQKVHLQSNSVSALTTSADSERSASKWNCCLNLHNKNRDQTISSSNNRRLAEVAENTWHQKSVGDSQKVQERSKKLPRSRTKHASVSSTTKWHVTAHSAVGIVPDSSTVVHATTVWHVSDIGSNCNVHVARTSDIASPAVRQCDTSTPCEESVYGGHENVPSDSSMLHDKTRDKHSTTVRQNANCTYYYCVSLHFAYNFCCISFPSVY